MAGQIERELIAEVPPSPSPTRSPPPAAVPMPPRAGSVTSWPSGSRMSSTGTWIFRSSGLRTPASTILQSRPVPTRKRPTSSRGRWVADRPIRCTVRSAWCSRRSRVNAR